MTQKSTLRTSGLVQILQNVRVIRAMFGDFQEYESMKLSALFLDTYSQQLFGERFLYVSICCNLYHC